jgi:hypothetical protein
MQTLAARHHQHSQSAGPGRKQPDDKSLIDSGVLLLVGNRIAEVSKNRRRYASEEYRS